MRRRIIWIILGALLLVALIALLWWWILGRGVPEPNTNGQLGTSPNVPGQQQGGSSGPTNVPSTIPTTPTGVLVGGSTQGSGSGSGGSGGLGGTGSIPRPSTPPGVSWLGSSNIFSPTPINQVDSGSVSGSLSGLGGQGGGGGGGNDSNLALLGAPAALCAAALLTQAAEGATVGAAEGAISVGLGVVLVYDFPANRKLSAERYESFADCITRVVAKIAIQQMTASIVNWINSGFEGKPSFVQNYEQFFSNVADAAAGEVIRGSALSFLCSPFQAQVRIAIAQSYARRNNAGSCTLTGVTNNINSFLRGNFSAGGWKGLFSLTTMPTNNPYGAFMAGEVGIITAQSRAQSSANRNLSPGGFIGLQVGTQCTVINDPQRGPVRQCKGSEIKTPGQIIQSSLETTLPTGLRQLELADSFDEIINALIQQLMTRTLQSGLGSLSSGAGIGGVGSTPALAEAQALLTGLQSSVSVAQQYGYAKQGAIGDLQSAQQQLQSLANCWDTRGDEDKKDEVAAKIAALEQRVALYNAEITRGNAAIAILQDLQSRVLSATTIAEVNRVNTDFVTAQSAGTLIVQSQVTQAQQDRTALQSEMAALNQQTATSLNQCNAGA